MVAKTRRFRLETMTSSVLLIGIVVSVLGCQGSEEGSQQAPDALTSAPTISSSSTTLTQDDQVILEALDPCGPSLMRYPGKLQEGFLHWSNDGSRLVFNLDTMVWTLDIEGAWLQQVVNVDPDGHAPGQRFLYGFHANVSPDSSRIVYSSCEFLLEEPLVHYEAVIYSEGYELATVNIDGSGRKRLTRNNNLDNYPVWSPNGEQIAFIAYVGRGAGNLDPLYYPVSSEYQDRMKLVITSPDATSTIEGETKPLLHTTRVALFPPVWSPDSQRLAYLAYEGEAYPHDLVLFTVRHDGSDLIRIGQATVPAAWSPDGDELAFASVDEEAAIIYAVKPDGSDLRTVWRSETGNPNTTVSQVLWSPNGSELLFLSGTAHLVRPDGTGLRSLLEGGSWAAWSPDGSRIAFYQPGHMIYTVSRDGTDLRVLVKRDDTGKLIALNPEPEEE